MPIAIGIREQRRCETTLFLFLEIAHHSTVAYIGERLLATRLLFGVILLMCSLIYRWRVSILAPPLWYQRGQSY